MFYLRPKKLAVMGRNALIGLLAFFLFSGMARRPMKEIEQKVTKRTGIQVEDLKRNPDKAPTHAAETHLLADQLSMDTALKIALTNNSEIQATFQELGIARADVWQATLFKNPTFEGFVRFPNHETLDDGDPAQNNVELGVSQDFIDVLLMPFKRRVASAEYAAVKLRVADAILSFVLEVKKAYYTVQAAEQAVMFQKTVLEASEAALELGNRQLESGNLKALDLSIEQVAYEEAGLEYEKSLAEERLAREPLNRLMGLDGPDVSVWKIGNPLHDLPETDPTLDDLEARALTERLDLEAIRQQTKAFKRNLTATRLGVVPQADVGINTEKEIDGGRITGPTWNVEVPVWDQQLAQGSKAKAQWRQNKFQESAHEIQVQSEVREAVTHLQVARTAVERYQNKIIPEREKILGLYLREYNYMLTGVYQLLDAKQKEVLARRASIENLRDYWIALAELEKAVGGKLEFEEINQKPNEKELIQKPPLSKKVPAMDHSHHHGGHQS